MGHMSNWGSALHDLNDVQLLLTNHWRANQNFQTAGWSAASEVAFPKIVSPTQLGSRPLEFRIDNTWQCDSNQQEWRKVCDIGRRAWGVNSSDTECLLCAMQGCGLITIQGFGVLFPLSYGFWDMVLYSSGWAYTYRVAKVSPSTPLPVGILHALTM